MYEKHFSFKYKPFDLVPNPDFLFPSSTHKKAITYLDYGIKEKIGFILLTGEIGSGKTTIIRNLMKSLNDSARLSRVSNTKGTSEQLIAMINEDFGLHIEGKSKTRLLSELNEFLIEQYSRGLQPILLIDEAQNLSPDLLEEIRLLSNLETDKSKLLQIILVGQPELKKTLMLPELMQLRQRININYHITPLTFDETAQYIKHRITIAGNPDVINFQGDMLSLIYQFSRGIPRLINILCDFALLAAYVEGRKDVSTDIIREVTKDLESRDYWYDSQDIAVSEARGNDENPDLVRVVESISRRLIKLEETVSQIATINLPEIVSLSEKIVRLEKLVSEIAENHEDNPIHELLQRISRLERLPLITEIENSFHNHEADAKKPLTDQVELLKKLLNDVNNKLRNT